MIKHVLGLLIGITTLVLGILSYPSGAYYAGRFHARYDLMRGKYQVRVYGLRGGDGAPYWALLRKRYGIEEAVVGSCVVTEGVAEEARGYNEVMGAALMSRFGEDIFHPARLEAEIKQESESSSRTPQTSR
jgi:hypothetical protein